MTWKIILAGVIVVLAGLAGCLFYGGPRKITPLLYETASACPDPLVLKTPVDLQQVTSILYPGQVRGGDFKRHGGFRFDGATSNQMEVQAPIDSTLVAASRYIEQGEVQYLLDFETQCGIKYRFDHLLVLVPKVMAAVEKLPAPQVDDSRTTNIQEPIQVKSGEVIATSIGEKNNVFVDFGVYRSNGTPFEAPNSNPVCWFDLLSSPEAVRVKSLPAGDSQSGKQSEYCQ